MLLRDADLQNAIDGGWVRIAGYAPEMLQPSSIDVRLDRFFQRFAPDQVIDPQVEPKMVDVEVGPHDPFWLEPGEVALGSTWERITLPDDMSARVEGKSSVARLGASIHVTAGFVDPGFDGHVTLELVNHHQKLPMMLWPGMKIGQLCIYAMSGKADRPYGSPGVGSHYQGQRGPTASRSHMDFRTWPTTRPS